MAARGRRRGWIRQILVFPVGILLAVVVASPAVAADFTPAPGTYTADTSTLTITGPGTTIPGDSEGGVAVFRFDTVSIPAGVTINVRGIRPFKLEAAGALTLAGIIDGSGTSAANFSAAPTPGGPGGGGGGAGAGSAGAGPGGGAGAPDFDDGGGGGGFGGAGARGGNNGAPPTPAAGGPAYGTLASALQGGSGGGGATEPGVGPVSGGGGGGGIALLGSVVTMTATGEVRANGGGGASGGFGASGGGSGGGILIRGETVDINGVLSAVGGGGGAGGCCGDGGGGGGGRIVYMARSLLGTGSANVSGGASGSVSSCCGSGVASPDPSGAPGVVTELEAPRVITGTATKLTASGATLNGIVNPRSSATTYYFQWGKTTAYGNSAPTQGASVGSDGADHAVSRPITGLAPNTVYHFRLVASNASGFTSLGPDATFKTRKPSFGAKTRVSLALATSRVPPSGRFGVRIANRNPFAITGRIGGKAVGRTGAIATFSSTVAAKRFRVAAKSRKTVKLKLSARQRRRLAQRGRLVVKLIARVRDPAGNTRKVSKKVVLRPKR